MSSLGPLPLIITFHTSSRGFRAGTWGVFHVTSAGVWVSPLLCVTPCMGFGAVREVCVASHLWACVCPPSSVLPLVWVSVLYVGCVSRPICGRVCVPRPLCEPVCGFGWYPGCVSRHYCGRLGVPGLLFL